MIATSILMAAAFARIVAPKALRGSTSRIFATARAARPITSRLRAGTRPLSSAGVPQFDEMLEDQARRFIALVDEFYDRRVKLILSAAVDVRSLYAGRRLASVFERTLSRLVEMQSTEYLALPHLA